MDVLRDRELLKACYDRLQSLEIVPTVSNMETLLQTLYDLREVYRSLEGVETDGRTETDPKRQPDD